MIFRRPRFVVYISSQIRNLRLIFKEWKILLFIHFSIYLGFYFCRFGFYGAFVGAGLALSRRSLDEGGCRPHSPHLYRSPNLNAKGE